MAASHNKKVQRNLKKPIVDASATSQIKATKEIRTQHPNPTEYDNLRPVWSFKRMKSEAKWIFPAEELICCDENACLQANCVLSRLADFETMTWREIKQQQRGESKGKSCNHFIDENLDKLHADARKRLKELQITENFFSLSLGNVVRIFGVMQSQVLEILWYDNKHEIYPIEK